MDGVEVSRPAEKVAEALAAEVRHWRLARGWTRRELAQRLSFDLSYVARVESGKPTENFARRADMVLEAGGRIWALWEELSRVRATAPKGQGLFDLGRTQLERTVRVERDESVQTFDGSHYTVIVTRQFYNASDRPVVRCPVGIAAGHFVAAGHGPAYDPLDSAFWDRIELDARCGDQPMRFKPEPYPDRLAEGWLYFENDGCRFPLYPDRTAVVQYSYRVPRLGWGDRLERAVTLPTAHLSIALRFPREFAPQRVWGTEDSAAVSQQPLSSEIGRARADDTWAEYRWTTTAAPLWTSYRLEWQFPQSRDGGRPHRPQVGRLRAA